MSLKNSNDTIGNRTRDLPVCSVMPSTLRHRAPPIIESVQYFCSILTKLVFSWQVSKQVFSISFHETPSSWIRDDTGGGTDGHT